MEEAKSSAYPEPLRSKPFEDSWQMASLMKSQLGASHWSVSRTESFFKSGRPVEEVVFHGVHPSRGGDENNQIKRRGMTLISKTKGTPYVVAEIVP
jgi:hypothetical protein